MATRTKEQRLVSYLRELYNECDGEIDAFYGQDFCAISSEELAVQDAKNKENLELRRKLDSMLGMMDKERTYTIEFRRA